MGGKSQNWTRHSLVQVSTYVLGPFPFNTLNVLYFDGAPPSNHAVENYRYVVDGEWLVDPTKQMTTDSKGNTNNVVMVEDNRVTKCQKEVG